MSRKKPNTKGLTALAFGLTTIFGGCKLTIIVITAFIAHFYYLPHTHPFANPETRSVYQSPVEKGICGKLVPARNGYGNG